MLGDKQKVQRMTSSPKFLQWYSNEGEKFLDHVVTGGETWISYSSCKAKKQSTV
jgi:hypothetical protein